MTTTTYMWLRFIKEYRVAIWLNMDKMFCHDICYDSRTYALSITYDASHCLHVKGFSCEWSHRQTRNSRQKYFALVCMAIYVVHEGRIFNKWYYLKNRCSCHTFWHITQQTMANIFVILTNKRMIRSTFEESSLYG